MKAGRAIMKVHYKLTADDVKILTIAREKMIQEDFHGRWEFICLSYDAVGRSLGILQFPTESDFERAVSESLGGSTFMSWLRNNYMPAARKLAEWSVLDYECDDVRRYCGQIRIGWIDTMLARGFVA